jgi:hypothetical protein
MTVCFDFCSANGSRWSSVERISAEATVFVSGGATAAIAHVETVAIALDVIAASVIEAAIAMLAAETIGRVA